MSTSHIKPVSKFHDNINGFHELTNRFLLVRNTRFCEYFVHLEGNSFSLKTFVLEHKTPPRSSHWFVC